MAPQESPCAVELVGYFLDCVWNVMAHAQKPDFAFRRNGPVHLNRWGGGGRGCQFSRLLAAGLCASAVVMVVMLDTSCSKVVWRVMATHSIRLFPLHFPTHASPCAITFQPDSTCFRLLTISVDTTVLQTALLIASIDRIIYTKQELETMWKVKVLVNCVIIIIVIIKSCNLYTFTLTYPKQTMFIGYILIVE